MFAHTSAQPTGNSSSPMVVVLSPNCAEPMILPGQGADSVSPRVPAIDLAKQSVICWQLGISYVAVLQPRKHRWTLEVAIVEYLELRGNTTYLAAQPGSPSVVQRHGRLFANRVGERRLAVQHSSGLPDRAWVQGRWLGVAWTVFR